MFYYSVVLHVKSKQNVVVPIKWIKGLDEERLQNTGINVHKIHRVFYCRDYKACGNFGGSPATIFNENRSCWYYGQVKVAYSKYSRIYSGSQANIL